jgi:hypothetical protein
VGALSDERTGLSFVHAASPRQRSIFSGPSSLDLATIFYCLSFETSLFVASYDSQGHGGGIRPLLHTGPELNSKSKDHDPLNFFFMLRPTVSSWRKAPIWGLRPDLYCCWTVAGLLMWGALSDERTGLPFARLTPNPLMTPRPRYIASARTAQETPVSLLRVLTLPG